MKITGHEAVGLPVTRIRIPREGDTPDIYVRVQALPMGVTDVVEELFPSPEPPVKYATNAKGNVKSHANRLGLQRGTPPAKSKE